MEYLHNLLSYNIILNSLSPRRKQLLENMGFNVIVEKIKIDEDYPKNLIAEKIPQYLAEKKANSYNKPLLDKQILIACDTVVIVEDKILGKPKDFLMAQQMLSSLSNKWHKVVSGCCIKTKDKNLSFKEQTLVKFKRLSEEEINYYINKYSPFDKAGSYGIQEWIGEIGIERIEGDFYNVMGLPTQRLYDEMIKITSNE
ncbi:MAG: Maf family nucleotide pyrophosphatase [Bacteroidales bacterium]|jgi:septum formation protein|nr:Maf family nucleotide pyrophosphatase [Bacteroidales bacterium]